MPGTIRFHDIEPGVTMKEEVDEVTGFSRPIIVQSQDEKKHPQILVLGEGNEAQRKILMPAHAILMVQEGEKVLPGDILSKIPAPPRRPRTSRAACPAWWTSSRRAIPRTPP